MIRKWVEKVKDWTAREFPRVKFDVIVLILVCAAILWLGLNRINVQEVLFKLLLLSLPLIYWHISRQSTWGYIHLKPAIFGEGEWANVPPVVRAAVVFGILLGYPIVIHGCLSW